MKDEQNREIKELSLLFAISKKLSETLDLKSALRPILQMVTEHMGSLRGAVTILNRATGEIVIEEAYGLRPEEQAKGKYRIGEGITGRVINTGRPVIVPHISKEPLFLDRTGSRKHANKEDLAFVCVPITVGAEVIGTLSADRFPAGSSPLKDDARLLTIIASTISLGVRLRQLAQEEVERVKEENQRLHDELKNRYRPKEIIGNSKVMQQVYYLIEKVCRLNTTVLILGESGVGKERVAHAIHYNSERADGPFVKINCAALPESLIESELFGHERGAFTGALTNRKGRFEAADNGTIFLDEIGDLPATVQTKLLRVLQEREFERLGGNTTIRVNVRIIAATNRDLEGLMKNGRFREDLFYRLNIFPIMVPPLRERRTDVMMLADYFAARYCKDQGKKIIRISTSATDLLMSYHWPGNVRELENCMERAVILSSDGVIHSYHLPPNLQKKDQAEVHASAGALKTMVNNMERDIILEELRAAKGNMAKAARSLGITERMMGLRIAKHDISPGQFK